MNIHYVLGIFLSVSHLFNSHFNAMSYLLLSSAFDRCKNGAYPLCQMVAKKRL